MSMRWWCDWTFFCKNKVYRGKKKGDQSMSEPERDLCNCEQPLQIADHRRTPEISSLRVNFQAFSFSIILSFCGVGKFGKLNVFFCRFKEMKRWKQVEDEEVALSNGSFSAPGLCLSILFARSSITKIYNGEAVRCDMEIKIRPLCITICYKGAFHSNRPGDRSSHA